MGYSVKHNKTVAQGIMPYILSFEWPNVWLLFRTESEVVIIHCMTDYDSRRGTVNGFH